MFLYMLCVLVPTTRPWNSVLMGQRAAAQVNHNESDIHFLPDMENCRIRFQISKAKIRRFGFGFETHPRAYERNRYKFVRVRMMNALFDCR